MEEKLLAAFIYLFSLIIALVFLALVAKFIVWPLVRWYIKKCKEDPRRLVIFVLLAFSMTVNAQLKPKIAIGYDVKNSIRLTNIYGDKMTYYMPKFNFRTGLEYAYKNVSIYYDMQFWCKYENKHTSFSPEQGVFEVGIKYNVTDNIKITINHVCYHPLETSGDNHNGIYGGHKGIIISYGY